MRMRARLVVAAVLLAVTACAREGVPSQALSAGYEAALTDTIRALMQDYSSSWERVTCEDQTPILRFFDWSGPGLIDANETDVTLYPGDAWPELHRSIACGRESEVATLDSILVRVFTPDIVSVSWTFTAAYADTSGVASRARGAVLQVFRRTPDGWRSPVGMSTHQQLDGPPQP